MPDAGTLRNAMVDRLSAAGEITHEWEPAMRAVPRHAFIPDLTWHYNSSAPGIHGFIPLRRAHDPGRWMELAYADDAVTTQVDDGTPDGPDGRGLRASSSVSMPILVSRMLTALQAELGHRVLEIGAGTGYHAALLAYRLGARNVSTIEVDPAVAEHARAALHATGYGEVRVITGDGERGYAPLAPYDRLVSTAGVRRFPYQWVRQTRPGGRFITPWAHPYLPVLVELTVTVDGTAIGSVADPGMDFMLVRGQRMPGVSVAQILAGDDPDTAAATETDLHPYYVTGDWDAAFAIGQRVANCTQRYWAPDEEDEHATQWLLDPATGSWARVRHDPDHADGSYEVRQGGSRKLWDEVEAAFHWWDGQGRPKARDWRIEVRADRQLVTLPAPHEPVTRSVC